VVSHEEINSKKTVCSNWSFLFPSLYTDICHTTNFALPALPRTFVFFCANVGVDTQPCAVSSYVYLSTRQPSISLISRTEKEPKTPHSIAPAVCRLTWPCVLSRAKTSCLKFVCTISVNRREGAPIHHRGYVK